MSMLAFLHRLVGGQVLGDHLTHAVNVLLDSRPGLLRSEAYQHITDQADAGAPAVIAATRQTWVRRPDVDAEECPARALYILERTETGIFAHCLDLDRRTDTDDDGWALFPSGHRNINFNNHDAGAEFGCDLLDLYELKHWDPFENLLPTISGTSPFPPNVI